MAVVVGGALAFAGCGGGDDDNSSASEEKTTPAQAVAEIGEVRTALDGALDQLRSGDKAGAEETVSEAYLQHFEKVEGPLDERDHELNEELEETLRGELREKIKTAPTADVEKLVDEIKGDLDTAEAKLQ